MNIKQLIEKIKMLSNRLAIIFLLTRRVSCHGVGVTGDLSLEKDTNWKISSCTDCNNSHIKDSTHMSYAHSFIPFTPAYKILFNYKIHSLPKTNKIISHIYSINPPSREFSYRYIHNYHFLNDNMYCYDNVT